MEKFIHSQYTSKMKPNKRMQSGVAESLMRALNIFAAISEPLIIFGGLAMWPWMRSIFPAADRRTHWLKYAFYSHLFGLLLSCFSIYYNYLYYSDWGHSFILVYIVGAISLLTGFVLIVLGKHKHESKDNI
jgi:hypothetical protein